MVEIKVEYHLLGGEVIKKKREIETMYKNFEDISASFFNEGDFISLSEEKPNGMFRVKKINNEEKKFILEEIDCNPIHWKGNKKGIAYGPNNKCEKKCKHYNNCPISVHLSYMDDVA